MTVISGYRPPVNVLCTSCTFVPLSVPASCFLTLYAQRKLLHERRRKAAQSREKIQQIHAHEYHQYSGDYLERALKYNGDADIGIACQTSDKSQYKSDAGIGKNATEVVPKRRT